MLVAHVSSPPSASDEDHRGDQLESRDGHRWQILEYSVSPELEQVLWEGDGRLWHSVQEASRQGASISL